MTDNMSRTVNREESWDSVNDSEFSSSYDDESNTEEMGDPEHDGPVGDFASEHASDAPPPELSAIEQFAEALDRLSHRARARPTRQGTCAHALPFVREYERIATDIVGQLADDLARAGARTPTSRSPSRHRAPQEAEREDAAQAELRRWEQERQTWQLAGLMLQVQYPIPDTPSRATQRDTDLLVRPTANTPLHDFSSEHDAWRAYLGACDGAWEQHVVTQWLQRCAEADGPELRAVVDALERSADRGPEPQAHGWLHTKQAIKEAKRLRGVAGPLPPSSTAPLDGWLGGAPRPDDLVTQLDPDAAARQGRRLTAADGAFERATWLACWTMLRRGRGWDAVRRWCRKRSEGWRALTLRGDPRFGASEREPAASGAPSQALWRKMCRQAAREGGMDVYEKAIYGILCGDYAVVEPVLADWNDRLFGLYSCQLIRNFDEWVVQGRPQPYGPDVESHAPLKALEAQFTSGMDALEDLLDDNDLEIGAQQPLKVLQRALISKTFPRWIFRQGLRMGQAQAGQHHDAAEAEDNDLDDSAYTPNILRILTHLILAFGEISDDAIEASVATDNVIDGYVAHLGDLDKQQLLPLYAHLLSPEGTNRCLARQLPRITESAERVTMAGLMAHYDMDALRVLRTHLEDAAAAVRHEGEDASAASSLPDDYCAPLRLVDESSTAWNGQPPLNPDFLGDPATNVAPAAEGLIGAVEWFLCLKGHYHATLAALVFAYQRLFRTGQPAAAVALRARVPLATVLTTQAPATSDGEIPPAALEAAGAAQDLETLAAALDRLHEWLATLGPLQASQLRAEQGLATDPAAKGRAREQRDLHRRAHDAVQEAVEPLLDRFLEAPSDDAEAAQFAALRTAHLPELAVAYAALLDLDGHLLSREHLARALDLAATGARAGSALGRALAGTRGGAARLLAACARASVNVVAARAEKKPAKGRAESGLEIWDVTAGP